MTGPANGESDRSAAGQVVELTVELLGPLRVTVGGRETTVAGRQRRSVLAVLALAAGRTVTVDTLVDTLWPADPPPSAAQALLSHVSRLRRDLGPAAARLRRNDAGYCLDLSGDGIDVQAVRAAVRDAEAGLRTDPARVAQRARDALGRWRGEALSEFAEVPDLAAAAVGLRELRRRLRDLELEARLALDDRTVTLDAATAAAEDPLRERTTLLWMRALAADGRAAEAMEIASMYRRRLADQTGLDPGAELSDLEQRIAAGMLTPRTDHPRRSVARPAGPMFGRDREREELLRLLSVHPVVSVVGPGGVGKTRLALEVAADAGRHGDVELVRLATVTEPDRVGEAVVSALGLQVGAASAESMAGAVATAISGTSLLLVLDNCEHVAEACRELVAALRLRAAEVRVLATSRVTPHLAEEHVLRLQPLPLPRDRTDVRALARQPSVQAFVAHARRGDRSFALTEATVDDAVEVVCRLDGLPLALELAAAQLPVVPLAALRQRLGRALDALTDERPAGDAPHQTLRTTLAWSYRLLDPGDQALARALAPFPGGADLETVEELARRIRPGRDPLAGLRRLVDASLLTRESGYDTATPRYTMLETVRAFLHDELGAAGEADDAHGRLVSWACATVRSIGSGLRSPDEPRADARLRAELPNLRAARDLARASGDLDAWIEITSALGDTIIWRDLPEVWSWARELGRAPELSGHPREVAVLGQAAEACWLLGELDEAVELARRGLRIVETEGRGADQSSQCRSGAAAVALFRGDPRAARDLWLSSADSATDPAIHLASAALAALYADDEPGADRLIAQARRVQVTGGSPSHRAWLHYVSGELASRRAPRTAVAEYTAAVDLGRRCGAMFVTGVATVGLASVWTRLGEAAPAADAYRLLLEQWLRAGNRTQLWTTAREAACLLLDHGRYRASAMLLTCADAAHAAAAMTGEMATRVRNAYRRLDAVLGTAVLDGLRSSAPALPTAEVVAVGRQALAEVAGQAATLPAHGGSP